MKTSTSKNDYISKEPAPETAYNRDFARICLALHSAGTIREAESILVAAWLFASQLDRRVTSVTYDECNVTLNRRDGAEAAPWARAAWRGFHRALSSGPLSVSSATIVPVRGVNGSVAAVSITQPTVSPCCQQLPLHLSLELYAAEIDSEHRRNLACRPPRPTMLW